MRYLDRDITAPSKPRLKLGRGVKGGAGALGALAGAQPAQHIPRVRPVAPLQPPGFAVDLTPASRRVPLQYRGAAILNRGFGRVTQDFIRRQELNVPQGTALVGKGQKAALDMLQDPEQLYNAKNSHALAAIVRPGAELSKALQNNPALARNRAEILKRISMGDEAYAKEKLNQGLEGYYKQNLTDDPTKNIQLGNQLSDVAQSHGLTGTGGFGERLVSGAINSVVMLPAGVYATAKDPKKEIPNLLRATATSYKEMFTTKQAWDEPFVFGMNALAIVGAAEGTGARLSSMRAAVKATSQAGTLPANLGKLASVVDAVGAGMKATAAVHGLTHPKTRGLIQRYDDLRKVQHTAENQAIADEISKVFAEPRMRPNDIFMGRQVIRDPNTGVPVGSVAGTRLGRVREEVTAKRKASAAQYRSEVEEGVQAGKTRLGAHVLPLGKEIMRETVQGIRVGTIYLRPAYIPNNWAGNTFMNAVHQGMLAPINLAKSLVMHKQLAQHQLHAVDHAMGQTSLQAIQGHGMGNIRAFTDPLVRVMGKAADTPFRRAAFLHEARRAGYRTIDQVKQLVTDAEKSDVKRMEMADIARKAQEEIVRFGQFNEKEWGIARDLFFVWHWVKGSTRYAARVPLQHPIQAMAATHLAARGQQFTDEKLGGLPTWMLGSIPVGRTDEGDPILVNPFNLNPLGTSVDWARAIHGSAKIVMGRDFDKFKDSDLIGVMHPLYRSYLEAREGGKPMPEAIKRTIAPLKLAEGIRHPGQGGVFPGTPKEALGTWAVGGLFPKTASQEGIKAALERENVRNPEALIPQQLADYKKATGVTLPKQFVAQYRADLEAVQHLKDWQKHYASDHGVSSFKKLPPQNKAEAALKYLDEQKHLPKGIINSYRQALAALPNDSAINTFANSLWSQTNIGQYKRNWDSLMHQAKGTKKTEARP